MMNRQYFKLYNLLKNNKITKSEFNLLTTKISNNWLDKLIIRLFNPYDNLTMATIMTVGLFAILFYSIMAHLSGVYFPGIPSSEEMIIANSHITFSRLLLTQVYQWLILSTTFYIISKLCRSQNIFLWDFLVYTAFAYLARFIFSLEFWILKLLAPQFLLVSNNIGQLIKSYPKILVSLWHINQLLMYIWLYRLYFLAMQLASGLSKTKLWLTFILGMVLAQSIWYNLSKYLL